jgi:hypothetical protein
MTVLPVTLRCLPVALRTVGTLHSSVLPYILLRSTEYITALHETPPDRLVILICQKDEENDCNSAYS